MKYILITFSNGDIYRVPAEVVASNYANAFAEQGTESWKDEYAEGLQEGVLEDWALNNMDWVDLKPHAEQMEAQPFDHAEEFLHAKISVV